MKLFSDKIGSAYGRRLTTASIAVALGAGAIGMVGTIGATGATGATAAHAAPADRQAAGGTYQQQVLADPAFQQVWARTDQLVRATNVSRSYYWGFFGKEPFYERYDQGKGGNRLVQYYDKGRMEVNDPSGDKKNPFYITSGLLSEELVNGLVQVGDDDFVQLAPADVDIASDTSDTSPGTPTYASFHNLIHSNPKQVGSPVIATINRAGQEGVDAKLYGGYNVSNAHYEPATHNNIPGVFWDFLNLTGPVIVNDKVTTARLSDPYFYVTGFPITAAYWASVRIAGKPNTAVLVQVYERRVLTYVPSAPAGWQVQMGNVGLHYFDWRYGSASSGLSGTACGASADKTGALWFRHPEIQQWLGCEGDYNSEHGATVAHQRFEHGEMLDVAYANGGKTVYILFEDGTSQVVFDTFRDGSPEPALNPPPGMYAPKAGFGKAWLDLGLQSRIGWALEPETVAVYDPATEPQLPSPVPTSLPGIATPTPAPPAPPTPTAVPPSGRGFPAIRSWGRSNVIIYTGPALHKFYVIHDSGAHWAAYDDTVR